LGRCVRPAAKAIESLRTVWHRGGSSPRRSRAGCPENPTAQPSAARAARGPLMEPNRTENDDELLEVPDLPETPLDLNEASAFDAPPLDSPPTLRAPLGDDDALKKMGSRTPAWAWLAFVLLLAGAIGGGVFLWQRSVAQEARWDAYD